METEYKEAWIDEKNKILAFHEIERSTRVAAPIVYAIINHYHAIVGEMDFNGAAQVGTGIAFIITSFLCKLGAEKDAGNQADAHILKDTN